MLPLIGQMFIKPFLQLGLRLPVAQETTPVYAKQPLAADSCRALPHRIEVQDPKLIVFVQKIVGLAVAVMNPELSEQAKQLYLIPGQKLLLCIRHFRVEENLFSVRCVNKIAYIITR